MRYRAFKDAVREQKVKVPEAGAHIIFMLPMPESWSKKKKEAMVGTPHQSKPDKDNLEKALLDAIYESDAHIWDSRVSKLWGYFGSIIIETEALQWESMLQASAAPVAHQ